MPPLGVMARFMRAIHFLFKEKEIGSPAYAGDDAFMEGGRSVTRAMTIFGGF
jgi:hypothetical protein